MRNRFSGRGFRRVVRPRRERSWTAANFDLNSTLDGELAAFELLSSADYYDGDPVTQTKTEGCTILRTAGRFELDVSVDIAQGYNAVTIWAYLAVMSERFVINTILAGEEISLDPTAPNLANRGVRIIRHFFGRNWISAVFNGGSAMAPIPHPVLTGNGSEGMLEWDVKQKVKLRTDDGLYLVLKPFITQTGEHSLLHHGMSRTLWAE